MPTTWHVWVPELHRTPGGIQRFSAHLLSAMRRLRPAPALRVLSKNDRSSPGRGECGLGGIPASLRSPALALVGLAGVLNPLGRPRLLVLTHAHFGPLARIARLAGGPPYWVVAHGIEVWNASRAVGFGLRGAERILCVSRHTRSKVIARHRVDPSRCVVFPNMVDTRRFAPGPWPKALADRLGISEGDKVILTVARLGSHEQPKGVGRVLDALPGVLAREPSAIHLIVGDGEARPVLEARADALGVRRRVVFAGRLTDPDLAEAYRLCDVFVLPSSKEGFGIVFLEAMATGKPVIAARGDGSVEPLADGELGVLVDADDHDALAEAIFRVLAGTHGHPLVNDPARLRREIVRRFGPRAFLGRLQALAEGHLG